MSPAHQLQRRTSYATRSRSTGIPASTLWRRANNKPSVAHKAANQQYLTPQEEQALVEYMLRLANNGYPLPVISTVARSGHRAPTILYFPGYRSQSRDPASGKELAAGFLLAPSTVESATATSDRLEEG
jgi:hypothetical protein